MLGQVMSCYNRIFHDRSGYVRLFQVVMYDWLCQIISGEVMVGQVMLV
jgi:hypothetical protein